MRISRILLKSYHQWKPTKINSYFEFSCQNWTCMLKRCFCELQLENRFAFIQKMSMGEFYTRWRFLDLYVLQHTVFGIFIHKNDFKSLNWVYFDTINVPFSIILRFLCFTWRIFMQTCLQRVFLCFKGVSRFS